MKQASLFFFCYFSASRYFHWGGEGFMVYYFIMTFLVHSICGESLEKMQLPRPRGAGRDEDDEKNRNTPL